MNNDNCKNKENIKESYISQNKTIETEYIKPISYDYGYSEYADFEEDDWDFFGIKKKIDDNKEK